MDGVHDLGSIMILWACRSRSRRDILSALFISRTPIAVSASWRVSMIDLNVAVAFAVVLVLSDCKGKGGGTGYL